MSNSNDQLVDALNETGQALRCAPSVKSRVLDRISAQRPASRSSVRWPALTALAASLLAVCLLIQSHKGPGASEAFAQAIDHVAKAHTFSCRQIIEPVDPQNKSPIDEMRYTFKEPDLERTERPQDGQVVISDYTRRRRISLDSTKKTAFIQDLSKVYGVDDKTGALELSKLDTRIRDRVLKMTAKAVTDMGTQQLNGKTVRVLQSQNQEYVYTVDVDPQTRQPVQIVCKSLEKDGTKWTFADIQIDADLD